MKRAHYLLKNITIINIILGGILIFFVFYLLMPSMNLDTNVRVTVVKKPDADSTVSEDVVEEKTPFPSDYQIIAEQNLFSEERKIIESEKDEADIIEKPDFILYGTLITDEIRLAYLEDQKNPQNSPGRGKRQTSLKIGESLGGFLLKVVEPDRVVMARGDDDYTIYLNDPSNPKIREVPSQEPTPRAAQAAPHVPSDAGTQSPTVQANRFEKRDIKNVGSQPARNASNGGQQSHRSQRPSRSGPRRGGGLLFPDR